MHSVVNVDFVRGTFAQESAIREKARRRKQNQRHRQSTAPRCLHCKKLRRQHKRALGLYFCATTLRPVPDYVPLYSLTFQEA